MGFPLVDILGLGGKLIDKLIPDPSAKASAQLELAKLAMSGELEDLKASSANITTEASSADKWTSRARPSFMYVIYALILSAIPMGILSSVSHDVAINVTTGFREWLAAIPSDMLALFGVGYVGYTGARSFEKVRSGK